MTDICFVIMPYGEKTDSQGKAVDFDDVYQLLIKDAIEKAGGIEAVRCDEIDKPGPIHSMMIEKIASSPLAIVDISMLNPNVFYELGVRHALNRSGTILIRGKGTQAPFNIEGFNCLEYDTDDPHARAAFSDRLQRFLKNALADPDAVDSLVFEVLDDLRIERGEPGKSIERQLIRQTRNYCYQIRDAPGKQVCIITGDLRNIDSCDIWVNSENTNMQMARFYERSVSGLIRYLGARKSFGNIKEDTIAMALGEALDSTTRVEQASVIPTPPGELEQSNNVRALFHVASVEGELGVGYRPIANIHWCVSNALRLADSPEFADQQLQSILFPIMGAGTGGGSVRDMAAPQVEEAVNYLLSRPDSTISRVCFTAIDSSILDALREVMDAIPQLQPADTA